MSELVRYITNYKESRTYKSANAAKRADIERWRAEQKLENEQSALLLTLEDYRNLTKEEKKESNKTAENICVLAIIVFIVAYVSNVRALLLFSSIMVILGALCYVAGVFNPVTIDQRRIRKLLKKMPAAKTFHEWEKEKYGTKPESED